MSEVINSVTVTIKNSILCEYCLLVDEIHSMRTDNCMYIYFTICVCHICSTISAVLIYNYMYFMKCLNTQTNIEDDESDEGTVSSGESLLVRPLPPTHLTRFRSIYTGYISLVELILWVMVHVQCQSCNITELYQ